MMKSILDRRLTRRDFATAAVNAGDYRNGDGKRPIIPATKDGFATRASLNAGPVMLQFGPENPLLQGIPCQYHPTSA